MPENNTGFWLALWHWIENNLPFFAGGLFAGLVGTVREKREGSSWLRAISEGFMCACFAFASIRGFEAAGISESWAEFWGVVIGFIGTRKISDLLEDALQYLKTRFWGQKP